MALQNRDKKFQVRLPVCKWCGAVAKHQSYQCKLNPKNKCSYCQSTYHTSLMCPNKPRRRIKQESDKSRDRRTETSRLWFEFNPPGPKGTWDCYLGIAPDCYVVVTRSTIQLEHVKSKARYPELKYDLTNIRAACPPCNKLKGSLDLEELPRSIRIAPIKKAP